MLSIEYSIVQYWSPSNGTLILTNCLCAVCVKMGINVTCYVPIFQIIFKLCANLRGQYCVISCASPLSVVV